MLVGGAGGPEIPVAEVPDARPYRAVLGRLAVDLAGDDLQLREPGADPVDAAGCGDQREEDDLVLLDPAALDELLDGPDGAGAGGQDWVHQQDLPLGNVVGQLLVRDARAVIATPMDEDLAELYAQAAGAQCVLHRLARPDHRDAAYIPAELDAMVGVPRRGLDGGFREGQLTQPHLHDQSDQPVRIEDEVAPWRRPAPDLRVHAPRLHSAFQQVQVGVDPPEVLDLQLRPYVLRDQLRGNGIVVPPGYDDVGLEPARQHVPLEGRLHKPQILGQDALDVAAALHRVALDSPHQAHVIVRVHEYLHVATLHDLGAGEGQDAFNHNDVCRIHPPRLVMTPLAGDEVVHGHVRGFAPPEGIQALDKSREVEGTRLVEVYIRNIRRLFGGQVPVELVQAQQHYLLVTEGLRDRPAHSRLAAGGAPRDPDHERRVR
mmetsp:Transcript_68545/g.185196  ORF Transcript_68545/g.185196 Transcript_68545/m.185196 type:complete len:432 (+) Transcript_68545:636-1931(+)